MRYELSDNKWAMIRPILPNKARGVPRVDDRRVLNGIFWVLCGPVHRGATYRTASVHTPPAATASFRWRRAGDAAGSELALVCRKLPTSY